MLSPLVAALALLGWTTTVPTPPATRRCASTVCRLDERSLDAASVSAQNCEHASAPTAARAAEPRCYSRRTLVCGALSVTGLCIYGVGPSASAYTVSQAKPDERDTYALAQKGGRPLRILWVGPGNVSTGVLKDLFLAGNEVVALDLVRPEAQDLSAAVAYATDHGYDFRFEQGDATKMAFADGSFDVVMSSLFLCQDFDPVVVVSEIRRVLKPGGRFGFYEHVEGIDRLIVDKVFGERSVVRVQAWPERTNVLAGVVRKIS